MTRTEMLAALTVQLEAARNRCAGIVGAPIVLMLEGLGYRIVPAWVVESFAKVIERAPEKSDGEEAGRG